MKLSIVWTNQFKKDYKLAIKRGLRISLLDDIIRKLSGDYFGYRECHIQPDWLLIYKIDNGRLLLTLAWTGSHSDLFGK